MTRMPPPAPSAPARKRRRNARPSARLLTAKPWAYLGVCRTTWHGLRRLGLAPPPVDLPGAMRWRISDIARWVKSLSVRPVTENLPTRGGPDHAAWADRRPPRPAAPPAAQRRAT